MMVDYELIFYYTPVCLYVSVYPSRSSSLFVPASCQGARRQPWLLHLLADGFFTRTRPAGRRGRKA